MNTIGMMLSGSKLCGSVTQRRWLKPNFIFNRKENFPCGALLPSTPPVPSSSKTYISLSEILTNLDCLVRVWGERGGAYSGWKCELGVCLLRSGWWGAGFVSCLPHPPTHCWHIPSIISSWCYRSLKYLPDFW